ncbi:MAG: integrase core domain-containing protein [Solirubrobacteraceae bacterium]
MLAGRRGDRSVAERRHEFETLDQAREVIAAYIDHDHHRPHSRLNYRTPSEVRQTWDDATGALQKRAA